MVHGQRRGSLVGQLPVGLGRCLFAEVLSAGSAAQIKRMRGSVGELCFPQVHEGGSGGGFPGERSPRPMLLLSVTEVSRQPEQLLVDGAANLLDLVPSQQATLQSGVPVVALQDRIAIQGLEAEGYGGGALLVRC